MKNEGSEITEEDFRGGGGGGGAIIMHWTQG